MEAWGASGNVEQQPLPRLYREAPVNSIWEGSGNVIGLDVLRALQRHPDAAPALQALATEVRGANAHLDQAVARLAGMIGAAQPADARRIAQAIATVAAGALLVRNAPAVVADAYCASRLGTDVHAGAAFGGLGARVDARAIVQRLLDR